jgi:hypothetical protein
VDQTIWFWIIGGVVCIAFFGFLAIALRKGGSVRFGRISIFKNLFGAEDVSVKGNDTSAPNATQPQSSDWELANKAKASITDLAEMDRTFALLIEEYKHLAGDKLAIVLFRQILQCAQRLFSTVVWPGAAIVASVKTEDPNDPKNRLKCYYPADAPQDRSSLDTIPRAKTYAGEAMATGKHRFVADTRDDGGRYRVDILLKYGIRSLVVWPITLRVGGKDGDPEDVVVACFKVDSTREGRIEDTEFVRQLLQSVTRKLSLVFQIVLSPSWQPKSVSNKTE